MGAFASPNGSAQVGQGDARLAISNAIVHLHSQLFGKGPTKAKTYLLDDLVLVVLRGGGTAVERTLTGAGHGELMGEVRRTFQSEVGDRFIRSVEEATGRTVLTLLSQYDPANEISCELFVLEPLDGSQNGSAS